MSEHLSGKNVRLPPAIFNKLHFVKVQLEKESGGIWPFYLVVNLALDLLIKEKGWKYGEGGDDF